MTQHWYTPLAFVAALWAPMQAQEPPAETKAAATKPTLETRLDNFREFNSPHHHNYDSLITELTAKYNGLFKDKPGHVPLDPYVVKSMIMQESGGSIDAFVHDPLQVANKGDFGLSELQDPGIYRRLGIPDLSAAYSKFTPTKRKKGVLDYSPATSMNAQASIEGGIIFLFSKYFKYETKSVETGDVFEHTVRRGESFDKIAKKVGSTTQTIKALNPTLDPSKLQIGTTIKVRKAAMQPVITGSKPWEKAVDLYNGEGVPNYDKEVYARLKTRVQ